MKERPETIDELIKQLEKIREAQDIPKGMFGPELGVTSSAYQKWTYGRAEPLGKNVLKLLNYIEKYENKNKTK